MLNRKLKVFITALAITILSGCSALSAVSSLVGKSGGTDVNTNAQVGQTNTQDYALAKTDDSNSVVANGDNATVSTVDTGVTAKSIAKSSVTKSKKANSVVADQVEKAITADKAQDVVTGDNSTVTINQTDGMSFAYILWLLMAILAPVYSVITYLIYKARKHNENS